MTRFTLIAETEVDDDARKTYLIERDELEGRISIGFEQDITDREDGKSIYLDLTHEQAYAFYKSMHKALFGEAPEWAPTRNTR